MPGGGVVPISGTADVSRVEAPVTVRAYLIIAFAAFGGIFFGYDTGWMGGVLNMDYFIKQYTGQEYPDIKFPGVDPKDQIIVDYRKNYFSVSSSNVSLVTSILSAGTFFGAIMAGDLADFIGRRLTIILGCAIFCVGGILETVSTGLGVMVAGRVVAGFGVGFISAIVILYMSEIAPKKVRGAVVAGYQFCITIGILLANCVVYATQERRDTGSYRIPIAVQFLWAIILAVGLALLPESPRYWVKKGKLDKAASALGRVRGQPLDSEYIQDELAEIIANHEYEMSVVPQTSYLGSWAACFSGSIMSPSSNARRSFIGITIQMMQQLTGINFIFYFGPIFFQQLGTIDDPFLISMVTTLVNVLSTPASFVMVEKLGRRTILIWGAAGMVIMQFIVAIIGTTAGKNSPDHPADPNATRAMIAFICLNISVFATTWGPSAWIVIGEIFPITIRSRGVGLSTASNWFWNCIISVITPYLVAERDDSAKLGSNVFFMWGGLCCISCKFFLYAFPKQQLTRYQSSSPTSSFPRPRVLPSSRSTRCWRRLHPALRASGSPPPLSLRTCTSARSTLRFLLRMSTSSTRLPPSKRLL
jgi:sugar porter (SP) family MFS transporter